MPTDLPGSRRRRPRQTQAVAAQKPSLVDKLLNTFMVGTVLVLFCIVLLQEKRFTDGEPGTVADAFMQRAHAALDDANAQNDTDASSMMVRLESP